MHKSALDTSFHACLTDRLYSSAPSHLDHVPCAATYSRIVTQFSNAQQNSCIAKNQVQEGSRDNVSAHHKISDRINLQKS